MQSCRAGGAVIIYVVDGDLRHAELVEDALAAGGVSVAIACYSLFNIVVIYLGVEKGFDASLRDRSQVSGSWWKRTSAKAQVHVVWWDQDTARRDACGSSGTVVPERR